MLIRREIKRACKKEAWDGVINVESGPAET